MKGHGRLILVAPEQGGYELKSSKSKPLDSNKVVNGTLVSVSEASGGRGSQDETGGAGRRSLVAELNFGGLSSLLHPQNCGCHLFGSSAKGWVSRSSEQNQSKL
jgi:hypothetical protein